LAAGYTVLQRYPARAWAPLERSQRDGNAVEVE
jgi:hypothetical protein